jgi:uncharacterized protein (DUF305 family)
LSNISREDAQCVLNQIERSARRESPRFSPARWASSHNPNPVQANRSNGDHAQTINNASQDNQFPKNAAQNNLAEMKLANLAEQKATSQDVKSFAQEIEKDHRQAENQLKDVAQKENITLPSSPNAKQQQEYQGCRISRVSSSTTLTYST